MSDPKPVLSLTTEDPYAIYGPGDKVVGKANFDVVNTILAKYIIVSLLAGCRITATGAKPPKQTFFHKQFKIPFHNKREDPERQLVPGQHKWDFEFRLPSSNDLPPTFCYKDPDGTAEILYCLVMCVYKKDSLGPTKENMCTLPIKYSPKRSPAIVIDSSLSVLCQHLEVKRRADEGCIEAPKSRIPRIITRIVKRPKVEQECFHVTLWLPRFAAFTDHMDICLKVQTDNENPQRVVQVRLMRVEYRLWALTRIAQEQTFRTQRHQIQANAFPCSSLLESNGLWKSLRQHAPFRIQPRLHGLPLGKDSFSSLCPSFGAQNIVREYSLDIDIFLSIHGTTHRARFEDNELVLLPHEMHLEDE